MPLLVVGYGPGNAHAIAKRFGAAGNATHVLRALVEQGVPNAGVVINDPETVAVLGDTEPGERRELQVGEKSGQIGSEPLPLEVEVVPRSDGRFEREDKEGAPSAGRSTLGCAPSYATGV